MQAEKPAWPIKEQQTKHQKSHAFAFSFGIVMSLLNVPLNITIMSIRKMITKNYSY